jgi:hydroxyethylthiazole kinase-like sugar kinase family protein
MNSARSDAYAAYHSGLEIASGASVVAVINDTIVTGPVDICLLDQKSHPIITGRNAVYNHTCTGNPASAAYAIDCGTRTNATVIPAIISALSTFTSFNSQVQERKGRNCDIFSKFILHLKKAIITNNYSINSMCKAKLLHKYSVITSSECKRIPRPQII